MTKTARLRLRQFDIDPAQIESVLDLVLPELERRGYRVERQTTDTHDEIRIFRPSGSLFFTGRRPKGQVH